MLKFPPPNCLYIPEPARKIDISPLFALATTNRDTDKMKTTFVTLAATLLAVPAVFASPQQTAEDIENDTREYWCQQQVESCPLLCSDVGKGVKTNECFPENLYYQCLCSDGLVPDYDEYSQTIPYFQCSLNMQDCIEGCGGASACQATCKETFKCGAIDPKQTNATATSSTSSSASSTSTSSPSGDDEDDEESSGTGFAEAESTDSANADDDEEEEENSSNNGARSVLPALGLGLFSIGVAGVAALL